MFNAIRRALGNFVMEVAYQIDQFGYWLSPDKVTTTSKTPEDQLVLEIVEE